MEFEVIDIENLERLDRLRQTGVLTDEEFQIQKRKLLDGKVTNVPDHKNKLLWWVGLMISTIIAAVALSWATLKQDDAIAKGETKNTGTPNARTAIGPTAASEKPEAKPQKFVPLAFATSSKVIGLNPDYLEVRLGIPREKNGSSLVFDVGGCIISYLIENGAVAGFDIDLVGPCQPDIQGKRISNQTMFSDLRDGEPWGAYVADCLTGCGNAADPTISLSYPGTRSNGFISVTYSAKYQQVSKSLELWEKSVRRKLGIGEYDLPENYDNFSCVSGPPAEVISLLRNANVQSVHVSNTKRGGC
jgi:hypothetical protein